MPNVIQPIKPLCTTSLVSKEISATGQHKRRLTISEHWRSHQCLCNGGRSLASQGHWWKKIDADNLLSGIPLAVKRQYLNRWHLDHCGIKMLYNYEQSLMEQLLPMLRPKIWLSLERPTWMSLPWWIWWDFLLWTNQECLGPEQQECLVDLLVVQQLLVASGPSVCPCGSDTGGFYYPSTSCNRLVVSNQLMERFPILVSSLLLALDQSGPLHQRLGKCPIA